MSRERSRRRRGTAIVAALALTTLAAALLASAAMVSSAGAHASVDDRASIVAEAAVQEAFAQSLMGWAVTGDSLPVGALVQRTLPAPYEGSTYPVGGTLTIRRLDTALYALTADVRVGSEVLLARRRVRLLVQRASSPDSASATAAPAPIARWSVADLY